MDPDLLSMNLAPILEEGAEGPDDTSSAPSNWISKDSASFASKHTVNSSSDSEQEGQGPQDDPSNKVESKTSRKLVEELVPAEEDDPKFEIVPDSLTVPEGEPAKFTCRVGGTTPVDVFWYRVLDEVEELEDSEKYDMGKGGNRYSVTILNPVMDDGGQYMCIAINEKGRCCQFFILTVKMENYPPGQDREPLPATKVTHSIFDRRRAESPTQIAEDYKLSSLVQKRSDTQHDPDLSTLIPAERRNLFKNQSSRDHVPNDNPEGIELVGIRRSEVRDESPIETDLDACDINFSAASIDSVAPVEKLEPDLDVEDGRRRGRERFVWIRRNMAPVERPEPDLDVEDGRRRGREQQSYDDEECENCGPLNGPCTILLRFYLRTKHRLVQRVGPCGGFALTAAGFVLLVGVAIFLGVFPKSFRYISYYQYALVQNTITNSIDRNTTYYPGCYLLFPAAKLITYSSTAHYVSKTMGIFTSGKLPITLSFHLQYFLKPEELGKLHAKFELDYDDVFQSIIVSTIRNEAGLHIIDDYRHKRAEIEKRMHLLVRRRLGGDCCETCCPSRCKNYTLSCQACRPMKNCDQAYHVDVRYFQMAAISIVDYVSERYMRQTVLKVEAEREYFLQEHAVIEKKTELLTKQVYNKAREITSNATAAGKTIRARAMAEKFGRVQKAYTEALKSLYGRLNVTQESHKLSLMLIRSLEDIQPNLYTGYGFDVNKLYSP